jgi:L-2-hydroxycarboxylate dehydrogenase (NAD+)
VTVLVSAEAARRLAVEVLEANGAPAPAAAVQAGHLVEADLRDRPSHGIQRLPTLVGRIRRGLLRPATSPELRWLSESLLEVDGRLGLGPAVAFAVLDALIDRARRTGVALGAIARAGHLGMLAPYLERAVECGTLVVGMTTSEALVHPHGGRRPLIGTNPIGIGIPTIHGEPLLLDMATAAISKGAIIAAAQRAVPLPAGVAIDADGAPTTDPGAAADGAISPFGGAKGYGLGLGIELLVGVVTGTAFGEQVTGTLDTSRPLTKGDLFLVYDPEAGGRARAIERGSDFLAQLRRSEPGAGSAAVSVPGDRSRRIRAERAARGYEVPDALWSELQRLRASGREAEELTGERDGG